MCRSNKRYLGQRRPAFPDILQLNWSAEYDKVDTVKRLGAGARTALARLFYAPHVVPHEVPRRGDAAAWCFTAVPVIALIRQVTQF